MKKVLFLCTGNSCRSQMAEGWARHLFGDTVEAYSAGTAPHVVDPRAVMVMAEAGVDISTQTSDHVDEYLEVPFDLVITVCGSARETCPVFTGGVNTLHHSFPDPPALARSAATEEEALEHYRKVRDRIRKFVGRLTLPMD
jgi:arsenate reductase